MTPFRSRGYCELDTFRATQGSRVNQLARLSYDDGSSAPWFKFEDGTEGMLSLDNLQHLPDAVQPPKVKLEMIELDYPELQRHYLYGDGSRLSYSNVTHFLNSETTHRLRTADGFLHIIEKSSGWRAIEIFAEEFTI